MERGETDGRHRDSEPLAADKRATNPLSGAAPKAVRPGGSCSKIEGAIPYQASVPGLVPGQWARGRERNGVADGRPGQAREDLRRMGMGCSRFHPLFSPFSRLFFSSVLQSRPSTPRLPLGGQPLLNGLDHSRAWLCINLHNGRRGDGLSDGARCARPKANPFSSLPNCIQTGSGPTWQSATRRVLGGPEP